MGWLPTLLTIPRMSPRSTAVSHLTGEFARRSPITGENSSSEMRTYILQVARGHGGEPAVLALEHRGHHVGRSGLVLGHNEIRLAASRCRRIIQLRTMHQHNQAGGLPLPFGKIGKHRPAIKPPGLWQ